MPQPDGPAPAPTRIPLGPPAWSSRGQLGAPHSHQVCTQSLAAGWSSVSAIETRGNLRPWASLPLSTPHGSHSSPRLECKQSDPTTNAHLSWAPCPPLPPPVPSGQGHWPSLSPTQGHWPSLSPTGSSSRGPSLQPGEMPPGASVGGKGPGGAPACPGRAAAAPHTARRPGQLSCAGPGRGPHRVRWHLRAVLSPPPPRLSVQHLAWASSKHPLLFCFKPPTYIILYRGLILSLCFLKLYCNTLCYILMHFASVIQKMMK